MYKLALLLVALVFAFFSPVLGFDFVRWDDDLNVTANPLVTEPWSADLAAKLFSGEQAMRFKPLHWLLFRGVYALAGFDPVAWHAVGLVFHLLATVLLPWVLLLFYRRLFPTCSERSLILAAGFCALAWAVHPSRVEAVAWVTGSTYPFTSVFVLSATGFYLRAINLPEGGSRRGAFLAAWMFSVCSFLSYPVALLLPVLFFVLELGPLETAPRFWWRVDEAETRRWLTRHALFFIPAVLAGCATLFARYFESGIFGAAPTFHRLGIGERMLAALAALGSFPMKFLAPHDLTPNQALMRLEAGWRYTVFLAAILTVATASMLWLGRRRHRGLGWVFVGYCALALPCLGVTELPTWPPDRYSYLLDMLLVGLAGAACLKLASAEKRFRRHRPVILCATGVWMALLGVQTWRLVPVWRDTDALFTHMSKSANFTERVEQQAHIYKLWGYHHGAKGDFARTAFYLGEARRVFREAIVDSLGRENPGRAVSLAFAQEQSLGIDDVMRRERGGWLTGLGRWPEARRDLEQVARARPDDARNQELLRQLEEAADK